MRQRRTKKFALPPLSNALEAGRAVNEKKGGKCLWGVRREGGNCGRATSLVWGVTGVCLFTWPSSPPLRSINGREGGGGEKGQSQRGGKSCCCRVPACPSAVWDREGKKKTWGGGGGRLNSVDRWRARAAFPPPKKKRAEPTGTPASALVRSCGKKIEGKKGCRGEK